MLPCAPCCLGGEPKTVRYPKSRTGAQHGADICFECSFLARFGRHSCTRPELTCQSPLLLSPCSCHIAIPTSAACRYRIACCHDLYACDKMRKPPHDWRSHASTRASPVPHLREKTPLGAAPAMRARQPTRGCSAGGTRPPRGPQTLAGLKSWCAGARLDVHRVATPLRPLRAADGSAVASAPRWPRECAQIWARVDSEIWIRPRQSPTRFGFGSSQ